MKRLVIIGASGHGKVVADIAELNGYEKIVFLDDNEKIKQIANYSVIGKTADAIHYQEYNFFVGIGNSKVRERIQNWLVENCLNIVTLIHPSAVIAKNVEIGYGTVIMAGVVINSGSIIGNGCIINTCSSVDHDNIIGDFSHVSVGSHLAGTVKIGSHTWIGAGTTVSNNINICDECMIGAGTVVVKNIAERGTYVGVPERKIK